MSRRCELTGKGVMVGKDYTIFALHDGIVQFESDKKTKFVSVY